MRYCSVSSWSQMMAAWIGRQPSLGSSCSMSSPSLLGITLHRNTRFSLPLLPFTPLSTVLFFHTLNTLLASSRHSSAWASRSSPFLLPFSLPCPSSIHFVPSFIFRLSIFPSSSSSSPFSPLLPYLLLFLLPLSSSFFLSDILLPRRSPSMSSATFPKYASQATHAKFGSNRLSKKAASRSPEKIMRPAKVRSSRA